MPSARTASKSATRVRFVVPTSTSRAPARRTISGIRTPPPISTSSPRDTATPPLPGQADRERDRRGVVVRDERVLRARERDDLVLDRAEPTPAPAGLRIELEHRWRRRRQSRRLDRRRRPRRAAEVRVQDHAGRVDDGHEPRARRGRARRTECLEPRRAAPSRARPRISTAAPPAASDARSSAITARATSATGRSITTVKAGPQQRGAPHRRSEDARPASYAGLATWRERMGVEPTARRRAPRHSF